MGQDRQVIVLDADSSYYNDWMLDLLSLECRAESEFDEGDWCATRDACKIVLISKN